MKLFNVFALLMAILVPLSAPAQGNLPPVGDDWEAKYTNGIAAVVNEEIVTVDQLREELRPIVPRIRQTSLTREEFDAKLEEVSFEVLRNLIDRILIVQDFEESGYRIPKVYIEKEYDDYITEEFNGDRVAFHEWLRMEGKTPRQFREDLSKSMIVDFMRNRMRKSQNAVSPAKILEYYEENQVIFYEKERVHLYQIMLAPIANESTDLLLEEARKILRQIEGGASFEDMARQFSKDDKKKNGGDWGWVERGDLAPDIEEVAFSLNEGQVSEPVVKDGYVFILYVTDKRNEGVQPLSKVKEQIEETLAAEMARQAQKVWLDRLRQDAYIRYYL